MTARNLLRLAALAFAMTWIEPFVHSNTVPKYRFGVEIELKAKPKGFGGRLTRPFRSSRSLHKKLVKKLRDLGEDAQADWPGEGYTKWYITTDASLEHNHMRDITLEAISPVLKSTDNWILKIENFWEAVDSFLDVETDHRCGTHVHVSPSGRYTGWDKRFTMEELRQVAYFVATTETWVEQILPPERLNNLYALSNSSRINEQWSTFGHSWTSHRRELTVICDSLREANDPQKLCWVMQRDSRYCLWNFQNTIPPNKGTIEFRGGRHVRGKVMTIRWTVFAIVFIALAIEKNHYNLRTTYNNINAWWADLKAQAVHLGLQNWLPQRPETMRI